ncbi:helix-turn-helix domain-containing protein [Sorangium sp. So ce269]
MLDPKLWANRSHPGPRTVPLAVTADQLADVEATIRPEKAQKRVVRRGEALRLMAAGVAASDIAKLLGVHIRTIFRWRVRFSGPDPVAKLADAHRSGRPRSLSLGDRLREGGG